MKANKTPIQELIDWLDALIKTNNTQKIRLSLFRSGLEDRLQKEKQFAFDCFQAGNRFGMDVCGSFDWGQQPTKPDFDEFYSKYVSQHTK